MLYFESFFWLLLLLVLLLSLAAVAAGAAVCCCCCILLVFDLKPPVRGCSYNVLQAFTMTSLKTIRNGAQVFDSNGKKCNSKFLLHYGFNIESNRGVR